MKQSATEAFWAFVVGVCQTVVFVLSVKYLWSYTAAHYRDDGWVLSAIVSVVLFLCAVLCAVASVGALPYWKSSEGKKVAFRVSVAILRVYMDSTCCHMLLPRIAGSMAAAAFMVWWPLSDFSVTSIVFSLLLPSMWTFLLSEALVRLLCLSPAYCLYLFSQEKGIMRVLGIFSRRMN
jgi:hypothetical protein